MYRERLVDTKTSSHAGQQLKAVMLAYHDYQHVISQFPLQNERVRLTQWQSERLRQTHSDLYADERYEQGLAFLLSQLYSPEDFSTRDRDLERVFPKLVKWLPDSVIETVAILVELNLLTQKLDQELTEILFNRMKQNDIDAINYAEAYRQSDRQEDRKRQILLVEQAGLRLDRYASNPVISWSLKLSKKPAHNAGLEALHQFITNGFGAFHTMQNVSELMQTIAHREHTILDNIFKGRPNPFKLK